MFHSCSYQAIPLIDLGGGSIVPPEVPLFHGGACGSCGGWIKTNISFKGSGQECLFPTGWALLREHERVKAFSRCCGVHGENSLRQQRNYSQCRGPSTTRAIGFANVSLRSG